MSLSSSFEQDGRQFACPGERVTFTCEVNRSIAVQLAAEDFICRDDPVIYLPTNMVNTSRGNSIFQANLVRVEQLPAQRGSFVTTLTAVTTNVTANTVVECADQLTSSNVVRKTLSQSGETKSLQICLCSNHTHGINGREKISFAGCTHHAKREGVW